VRRFIAAFRAMDVPGFCCGTLSVAFRSAKVAFNPRHFRGATGDDRADVPFPQQRPFTLLCHRTRKAAMNRRTPKSAFTLVELLVVITIIGVLIALLLPAVQAARESARRMQCSNNLKQIGVAFHNHASNKDGFPPVRTLNTSAYHGWVVDLLWFMEQEPLRDYYHYDQHFYSADNQPVVSTPLQFLICPSTPTKNRVLDLMWSTGTSAPVNYGKAATSDYWMYHKFSYDFNGNKFNPAVTQNSTGMPIPVSTIKDGLSETILVFESAGTPEHWIRNNLQTDAAHSTTTTPNIPVFTAAAAPGWAYNLTEGPPTVFAGDGTAFFSYSTTSPLSAAQYQATYTCAVNCNNSYGVYAFHPGGANVLFCDGSVHFLAETLSPSVLLCLHSADAGDIVSGDQY
jgi:prepilin-type processing-associated H-X9-DG protein/prepilin-type N-terminal cleavage/methylation domain-containing protein